jgi:hypothetical protein
MLGIARGYIGSIKEPVYGIKPPFVEFLSWWDTENTP